MSEEKLSVKVQEKDISESFLVIDEQLSIQEEIDLTVETEGDDGETEKKTIKHKLPTVRSFKKYQDKVETASKIASELMGEDVCFLSENPEEKLISLKYKEIISEGYFFFLSSEIGGKRTGLLSLCPTVLTAIKLWETLSMKDEYSKQSDELLKVINLNIKAIFKLIFRDKKPKADKSLPVFDASPYVDEEKCFYNHKGNEIQAYLDSIVWAVPVFLKIITLKKGNDYIFKADDREISKFLIEWCLDYVNESVLYDGLNPKGWNFTKMEGESWENRSLYFTYSVSNLYNSFFEIYKDYINVLREADIYRNELGLNLDWKENIDVLENKVEELKLREQDKANAKKQKIKTKNGNRILTDHFKELLDKIPDKATRQEMITDIIRFNGNKKLSYMLDDTDEKKKSRLNYLSSVLQVIRQEELLNRDRFREKLQNSFMYEDFRLEIAHDDAIKNSGQNNALFAGLLQIIFIFNTGYFDTLDDTDEEKNDKNVLKNIMHYHLQKTQRFFDDLVASETSFSVEFLIPNYKEVFKDDNIKDTAIKLRKQSVRVCSLTPILLKTTNLLSDYHVQYPQKQMSESLKEIGVNRWHKIESGDKSEKKVFRYLWEKDNYHAISNHFYVNAVFDFYRYYEDYEQIYIGNYEEIVDTLKQKIEFSESIIEHRSKIASDLKKAEEKHQQDLAELDKKMQKSDEEKALSEIGDKFQESIDFVIQKSNYLSSSIFIKKLIKGIRVSLAEELVKKYEALNLREKFEDEDDFLKSDIPKYLEELRKPYHVEESAELMEHILALVADVIIPTAIEETRADKGNVNVDLGNHIDIPFVEAAFEARQLLLNPKNKQIYTMFNRMLQQLSLEKERSS